MEFEKRRAELTDRIAAADRQCHYVKFDDVRRLCYTVEASTCKSHLARLMRF